MDNFGKVRKSLSVANIQFQLDGKEKDFFPHCERLLKKAVQRGSELVVFPEYFSLGLVCNPKSGRSFQDRLRSLGHQLASFQEAFSQFARRHGITIVAGSTLVWLENYDRPVNRCFVFLPDGGFLHQDKMNMTRFESEEWGVRGTEQRLLAFEVKGVRCAVNICYDVEFSSISTLVAGHGVEVLLVPSCTDTQHGYWRVRHCAEARAIENQCFVVVSYLVGGVKRFSEVDKHYGKSVILSPCDLNFPKNGVLASALPQKEQVLVRNLDLELLRRVRKEGAVLNLQDQRHRCL